LSLERLKKRRKGRRRKVEKAQKSRRDCGRVEERKEGAVDGEMRVESDYDVGREHREDEQKKGKEGKEGGREGGRKGGREGRRKERRKEGRMGGQADGRMREDSTRKKERRNVSVENQPRLLGLYALHICVCRLTVCV